MSSDIQSGTYEETSDKFQWIEHFNDWVRELTLTKETARFLTLD